jgi:hypothetical protein
MSKFPEIKENEYGALDLEFANSRYPSDGMTSADIADWWTLREGFVSGRKHEQSIVATLEAKLKLAREALEYCANGPKPYTLEGFRVKARGALRDIAATEDR